MINSAIASSLEQSRIIRFKDVHNLTGLSRTTVWRMCASGDFPQPISLGKNSIGWRSSEVEEWINNRPSVDYNQAK